MPSPLHNALISKFAWPHVLLVGRARSALVALIEELKPAGQDYWVLLPENICPILAVAIKSAGAKAVPVPVSLTTGLPTNEAFITVMGKLKGQGMVMPTYIYGFYKDYKKTMQAAQKRAWFVLENDANATTINQVQNENFTCSDAKLISFGYAKPIEFGQGGALFIKDKALLKALDKRVQSYPFLTPKHLQIEQELMLRRRHWRQTNKEQGGAELIDIAKCEGGLVQCSFAPIHADELLRTINQFDQKLENTLKVKEMWQAALAGLSSHIMPIALPQPVPWRHVVRVPKWRDDCATILRENGFDAGTNYPSLWGEVPAQYLTGSKPQSDPWGQEVLNLWLSPHYDQRHIQAAATLMKGFFENA